MNPISFTSLIVTYNSAREICDLLHDLYTHVPEGRVIIIDNASKDRTVEQILANFPQVHLIENSVNVGYARAVNQGIALCATEYVLLLNPDIRISSPRVFLDMENCMKRSRRIAVVAPLQFKDDHQQRSLSFTWSYLTPRALGVYLANMLDQGQVFRTPIRVTFLNAGFLFIRRSAFESVGRLTEKYFLYGEEPDLFLKFKRYGFDCYLLPNSAITHYRERSLHTVPLLARLRFRIQSALNVMDALVIGWTHILLDRFAIEKTTKIEGN